MNSKPTIESFIYAALIILCLVTMIFVACSTYQFSNTRIVYQGF